MSYSNYTSEGYRTKTKPFDEDDKNDSIWLRGKYLLDNGYIEARYNYIDEKDYFTGSLAENDKHNPTHAGSSGGKILTKSNEYTLTFNKKLNDKLTLLAFGDYIKRDGSSNWYSVNDSKQLYTKGQVKYEYGDNSYFIVGGDYKTGNAKSMGSFGPSDKDKETYAGYILNKITLGDWQFTQGYRREKNTYASASVFLIDTEDEIYYDKFSNGYGENKNFDGEVRRIGAQASFQHYFNKLTLRENITYIQPKITSGIYDGKEFAGVSRWNLNIGATYNITEKLMLNGDMYYLSGAYNQDDFSNKDGRDGDYVTFDINTRYKVNSGLEVYAGIRNLFDKEYYDAVISAYGGGEAYYPADGRSYYAGFRYNL